MSQHEHLTGWNARPWEHTTGVSNSYTDFHISCPGSMTSISLYVRGLFSFTLPTTAFAVSHKEQLARVNSVIRQSRRREVARNMTPGAGGAEVGEEVKADARE